MDNELNEITSFFRKFAAIAVVANLVFWAVIIGLVVLAIKLVF